MTNPKQTYCDDGVWRDISYPEGSKEWVEIAWATLIELTKENVNRYYAGYYGDSQVIISRHQFQARCIPPNSPLFDTIWECVGNDEFKEAVKEKMGNG